MGSNIRTGGRAGDQFYPFSWRRAFVRKDVLYAAGRQKKILFPVFTNGTLMDNDSLEMLSRNRNLLPVLSIEENERTTDARRGDGVFCTLKQTMEDLKSRGILFGASVTIHKEKCEGGIVRGIPGGSEDVRLQSRYLCRVCTG